MRRRVLIAAVVALGAALAASADPAAPRTATASGVDLSYEKFTLPNGLDVILHEDHRLPLVAVNLWYHVGPANETAGRTGFAHLFEHLMFEGSRHVGSKAHFRYLEAAGASHVNATTGLDRTNFFETLPSNQLELALWLESDRMGYLLEGLDAQKLANQRDVVRNERRQTHESPPYALVQEAVWHELFPPTHPYHAFVIGSHADIEAARLPDVRDFSREYYTPNNASLAIAGDIDRAAARRLVEKYFASIPAGPPVAPPAVTTPPVTAERRVRVTDRIELPRVYLAWLTDPVFHQGDAEADLAAEVLGGGRSSRLYRRLVRELGLAQDVSAQNSSLQFGSVFTIQATAATGVALEELERAIDAELDTFRETGPTVTELVRARNSIETGAVRQLEELGGIADTLNRYNHYLHDPGYLARDLARYDDASPGTVRDFAAAKLGRSARVVVEGVPGSKIVEDAPHTADGSTDAAEPLPGRMPDETWRAAPPSMAAPPPARLPTPVRFTLPNGLTVVVAEAHGLPIVSASVVTLSGTLDNPVQQPGLASFTLAMLEEGTRARSAAAIADAAADAGARLVTRSGMDASLASLTVLRRNLAPSLDLLADIVMHPRFATPDFDRLRKLRDGRLQQRRQESAEIGRRVLLAGLFGSAQPYGFPEEGTREGNARIGVRDLRDFWAKHYGPRRAALVLAGDLSPADARALAVAHFGAWQGGAPPPGKNAKTVEFERGSRILLVDRPGAPQSTLQIGLRGLARDTPDYVPLEILNGVFGGSAASRLNMNLRESLGYTYGAYSAFHFGRAAGYFSAVTQVRADVTLDALRAMLRELRRLHTTPPSSAELELAKGGFARSLTSRFETSTSVAAALSELYTYALPLDDYATIAPRVDAVTAIDVKLLEDRYFEGAPLKIVVIGDRAKLERPLRELGVGWVVVVDESGRPVG